MTIKTKTLFMVLILNPLFLFGMKKNTLSMNELLAIDALCSLSNKTIAFNYQPPMLSSPRLESKPFILQLIESAPPSTTPVTKQDKTKSECVPNVNGEKIKRKRGRPRLYPQNIIGKDIQSANPKKNYPVCSNQVLYLLDD